MMSTGISTVAMKSNASRTDQRFVVAERDDELPIAARKTSTSLLAVVQSAAQRHAADA